MERRIYKQPNEMEEKIGTIRHLQEMGSAAEQWLKRGEMTGGYRMGEEQIKHQNFF